MQLVIINNHFLRVSVWQELTNCLFPVTTFATCSLLVLAF